MNPMRITGLPGMRLALAAGLTLGLTVAARSFGASARAIMGEYLERWITEAPKLARETSDFFIDRPMTNVAEVVAGCRERQTLLRRVDPAPLTPAQRDRLDYFKGLEEFIATFHQAHEMFQRSQESAKSGGHAPAMQVGSWVKGQT